MPHIRPDCAEQSATSSPVEHRRKRNSLAVRLTRDVLLLRSAGSSRRAIAAALNLSQRRVQTILDGVASAVSNRRKPFVMRERDADFASVEVALLAGSTMRAEHLKYATWCHAPYAYSHFWRRFEDWLEAQPDPRNASSAPPAGNTLSSATPVLPTSDRGSLGFPSLRECDGWAGRRHAVALRGQVAARPVQPEIHVSPANACDVPSADRTDVVSDRSSLEGGLLFIAEPETALQVRKGALCVRYQDGKERTFPRGRHRLRSIMLSSPGANVTIEAMRFAIDEGITIFVMHRAGEALAVLTNAPTVNTSAYALELRRAQFASTSDRRSRGRF
jgi:CRISPR associated protein Cas1